MGMRRSEVLSRFDEIVEFSGLSTFLDTPVKRYSSGMYMRLAFSVAAHLEPEILLVDEVLAVGDAEFQKKCLGRMEELGGTGRTVLFVSHSMPSVLATVPPRHPPRRRPRDSRRHRIRGRRGRTWIGAAVPPQRSWSDPMRLRATTACG